MATQKARSAKVTTFPRAHLKTVTGLVQQASLLSDLLAEIPLGSIRESRELLVTCADISGHIALDLDEIYECLDAMLAP